MEELVGLNRILLVNLEQVTCIFGQRDGRIVIMEFLLLMKQNI